MRAYLFDIDGTLADCSHRLHYIEKTPKDWDGFFGDCPHDAPIEHICVLAKALSEVAPIVYVSGRSDQCRSETLSWLEENGLPSGPLYMRKAGDHRNDDIIKGELLDQLTTDGWTPIMAFDDRARCVNLWRKRGIPCAQVAEGNF